MSVKFGVSATWTDVGDKAEATFTLGEVSRFIGETMTSSVRFVQNALETSSR